MLIYVAYHYLRKKYAFGNSQNIDLKQIKKK